MIVTHTSPDWDAITSCWLLITFGGVPGPVHFVNTGAPDPLSLMQANAVVDTGKVYESAALRFDHHMPGHTRCAAALVYEWLVQQRSDLAYLAPLVALVNAGDTGKRTDGADWSRSVGIHALLSAKKAQRLSDETLLDWGGCVLNDLAAGLKIRAEAALMLDMHTMYRSADGLFVALKNAPQAATGAAFEAGARLVLFRSDDVPLADGGVTHAIGMQRAGEWGEPDCGALVAAAMERPIDAVTTGELATWFRHPAGFFAGRGTLKAPRPDAITASFGTIAHVIDEVWQR
jgi:hypothetical protein